MTRTTPRNLLHSRPGLALFALLLCCMLAMLWLGPMHGVEHGVKHGLGQGLRSHMPHTDAPPAHSGALLVTVHGVADTTAATHTTTAADVSATTNGDEHTPGSGVCKVWDSVLLSPTLAAADMLPIASQAHACAPMPRMQHRASNVRHVPQARGPPASFNA
jgi:hypothetical protein